MSDQNTKAVVAKSVMGIQPFTIDDIHKSMDSVKNKNFVKKSMNDNISGNNFNASNKSDASTDEILVPEYDIEQLQNYPTFSDSLSACIEVYSLNISGEHEFLEERETIQRNGKRYYQDSQEEVPPAIAETMKDQYAKINMFFDSVSLDIPWLQLDQLHTKVLHETGNAYYEVERSVKNDLQGLRYVEPANIRLTKREKTPLQINQFVKNRITLKYEPKIRSKYFRKFIQIDGSTKTYFREFNDPRYMDANTGEYLKDSEGNYIFVTTNLESSFLASYKETNGRDFRFATEIWHNKLFNTADIDGYGVPIWVSLIPVLLGLKYSDLDDHNILKNRGIPKYMMIIEGANADDIVKQMEEDAASNLKTDQKHFLIVSADSSNTGTHTEPNYKNPKIRIEPLSQLIQDGLKGKSDYVEKVNERVAGLFRLPTFYIGKLNNVNRSVAEVATEGTYKYVFRPYSANKDAMINMFIMTELRSEYYYYHSKASNMDNAELKLKAIKDGITYGSVLPREARKEYAKVLGIELEDIETDFMNTPYPISIRNNSTKSLEKPNEDPEPETIENTLPEPKKVLDVNKKKLLKLEESNDSEIYSNIKKRVESNFGVKVNNLYIYSD